MNRPLNYGIYFKINYSSIWANHNMIVYNSFNYNKDYGYPTIQSILWGRLYQ